MPACMQYSLSLPGCVTSQLNVFGLALILPLGYARTKKVMTSPHTVVCELKKDAIIAIYCTLCRIGFTFKKLLFRRHLVL